MNEWIENNYKELVKICQSVTKNSEVDDLLQICVEELLLNKKVQTIPNDQKLFFFTRIVRNNYNSTKSKYHYQYRKFSWSDLDNVEIVDLPYYETEYNMQWVKNQIEKMKQDEWYYGRLMELYIEEGCSITKLSKRTTIPINSVSRDINKVKSILKNERNKQKG